MDQQEVVDLVIMAVYRDRKAIARKITWPRQQRDRLSVPADVFLTLRKASREQADTAIRRAGNGELQVLGVPVRIDCSLPEGTIRLEGHGMAEVKVIE